MLRLISGAMAAAGLGLAAIETRFRRQPGNATVFSDHGWGFTRSEPTLLRISGRVTVRNPQQLREVMLVDVVPTARLLSAASVDGLQISARIISHDKDYPARPDGYWNAFVAKPGKYHKTHDFEVDVEVRGPADALDACYATWVELQVDTYGFEGAKPVWHHVVLTLSEHPETSPDGWRDAGRSRVLPIKTHLLTPLDDPIEVIKEYVAPHAEPGDIVTIGESPLAVIQGRFTDPRMIKAGWVATRLSQFMSGEGSVGTAGGMQSLVDQIGSVRVVAGVVGGAAAKAIRQDGWFYRICGEQSKLIDDVTGTLPPYDRFIVLGPEDSSGVCAAIQASTGLAAAVVDANDLGRVDVIGSTPGLDVSLIDEALRSNPAGNGAETTPIVLIRPIGVAVS